MTPGILIRRYKRFLADIHLEEVGQVTAHCPNTGSMLGCSEPGRQVYMSYHPSPKRKYHWTWELIDMGTSLVGINTHNTNRIWAEALNKRNIQEFERYDTYVPEVKLDPQTRLDFLLTGPGQTPLYIEVKNCTLVQGHTAAFPDAVTLRGQRHLRSLIAIQEAGMMGALILIIQRTDALCFQPAHWIDPEYARLLRAAVQFGVMVKAYDVVLNTQEVTLNAPLPIIWK